MFLPIVVSAKHHFLNIPVLIAFNIFSQHYRFDSVITLCLLHFRVHVRVLNVGIKNIVPIISEFRFSDGGVEFLWM
jgi:hypothetical protein